MIISFLRTSSSTLPLDALLVIFALIITVFPYELPYCMFAIAYFPLRMSLRLSNNPNPRIDKPGFCAFRRVGDVSYQ